MSKSSFKRMLRTFAFGVVITFLFCLGAAWLFLASPLARDVRINLTEEILSSILDQEVLVDGDARVTFRPRANLVIDRLRLPSQVASEADLAKLENVRLALPLGYFLGQGIVLPEIEARGLDVSLIVKEDGSTTWAAPKKQTEATPEKAQPDLVRFLGKRRVIFEDMKVLYSDERSGFLFDFELTEFTVSQEASATGPIADVKYLGLVNDQPVTFDGRFPDNSPFEARARFGALEAVLSGQKPAGQPEGEFEGQIEFSTPDIQNFLDTLRLNQDVAGIAKGTAKIARKNRQFSFDNIDFIVEFANGRTAALNGRLANALTGRDFDLSFLLDLVGKNPPPPPAVVLKDIRAKTIELRLIGADKNIGVERLSVETNAFEQEIRDIGPFQVDRIQRAEDGRLQLKGVTLNLGPSGAPYVTARGYVDDLLDFREYHLDADLNLPARAVLLTLKPDVAQEFGRLLGTTQIKDANGKTQVSELKLKSEDTELWAADIQFSSDDLFDADAFTLSGLIETPDGKNFLEALQLSPVDIGRIGLKLDTDLTEKSLVLSSTVTADETEIQSDVNISVQNASPVLRGSVKSELVAINDLRNALKALREVAQLVSVYVSQKSTETRRDQVAESAREDDDFQPLVLPTEQDEVDDEYQPLVIEGSAADIAIEDLLDLQKFVQIIDAEIEIGIDRLTGQIGVNSLNSSAHLKEGIAGIGPVNMSYQRGAAAVFAEADLLKSPEWVRIHGQTGGWDFGRTLAEAGVNIGAGGTLDGTFDLKGRHGSAKQFATSMTGSATIRMSEGFIETSLIELGGLGVLPWLFSSERRDGVTRIVCINAPIRADSGRLSSTEAVLETPKVQLVGSGVVDLNAATIDFRADPRPVGNPLSRSAWPFSVSGPLASPKVGVAERKRRKALQPLAMPDQRVPCVPDKDQLRVE